MANYRTRPWLKQRMNESEDSQQAIRIWKRWKALRQATANVSRAIRLYEALLQGDTDKFHNLMKRYFPGYGLSLAPEQRVHRQPEFVPVMSQKPKIAAKAQIVISSEAYNDNQDDFGFSSLDL